MTITLTTEEINAYTNKVSQWYHDCLTYILERFDPMLARESPRDILRKLRSEFESKNPRPDWKTLL